MNDMGQLRQLMMAGEYRVAHDIALGLEKIARIIGARRLAQHLAELRLHCSDPGGNQDTVASLLSACETELISLKELVSCSSAESGK